MIREGDRAVALFFVGDGSAGAGVDVWCGWDFCVRSNRKNRDSAAGVGKCGRRTVGAGPRPARAL